MFGYVRPARDRLSSQALARYQAVYCGLCHTLGRRYGPLVRLTLHYDFAFLALLLIRPDGQNAPFHARCPAHPLKKREMCSDTPGLQAAADESVILTWHKLCDAVRDEGFFRGLAARIAALLLRPAYRKAARYRPAFDRVVRDCLRTLGELEAEGCASLDRTADAFARLLAAAVPTTGDRAQGRADEQLLYHLGRWIYLIDARDDLEEDAARGRFNPILTRFGGTVDDDALRTTLRHSRAIACSAFRLLPDSADGAIIENVLTEGLPAVEALVFSGEWNAKRKGEKLR